jgi:hypothetical protein
VISPFTALASISALAVISSLTALTAGVLMFRTCCGALSAGPFSRAATGGRGGIEGEAHHHPRHHQPLGKPHHRSHGIDS